MTSLLTTTQVARKLSVTRQTVWEMSRKGILPASIQITPDHKGKRWFEEEIDAWLNSLRQPQAAAQ